MTDLRDRYADALMALLERDGPLADLAPVLERLDVLAGIDLAQKQLAPVIETPTPSMEWRPPVEHGRDEPADNPVGHPKPTAERGEDVQQANRPPHEPDDSPAAMSSSVGGASQRAVTEGVWAEVAERAENRCVDCQKVIAPQATRCRVCSGKARRHNPSTWNGARRPVDITKDTQQPTVDAAPKLGTWTLGEPQVDNAAPEVEEPTPVDSQTAAANSRDAVRHDVTRSVIENPARGLAAVSANPPVAAPSKLICTLYRKGGHRWPIPQQGVEVKEPVTLRCEWCMETREFDRFGAVWERSERNPAEVVPV